MNFKTRVLLFLALIISIITALFVVVEAIHRYDDRKEMLLLRAEILANNQLESLVFPLWNLNTRVMTGVLQGLRKAPDFVSGRVVDHDAIDLVVGTARPPAEDLITIEREIVYRNQDASDDIVPIGTFIL